MGNKNENGIINDSKIPDNPPPQPLNQNSPPSPMLKSMYKTKQRRHEIPKGKKLQLKCLQQSQETEPDKMLSLMESLEEVGRGIAGNKFD